MGKNNKLRNSTPKRKNFKLYKVKKQWVTACATFLITLIGGTVIATNVHADPSSTNNVPSTTVTTNSTTPSSEAENSNTGSTTTNDQPTSNENPSSTTNNSSSTTVSTHDLTGNPTSPSTIVTSMPERVAYNANDWAYTTNNDGSGITLTKYTGTGTDYYIPNSATFRDAGKLAANGKVYLTSAFMRGLYTGDSSVTNNGAATSISVEATDNDQDQDVAVVNPRQDWQQIFAPAGNNNNDFGAAGNQTLKTVDLSGLDASAITAMNGMFANDKALTSVNLGNWNTSHLVNIGHMFAFDPQLTTVIGLNNWDTSSLQYMDNLFLNDGKLTGNIDLSNWKTDQVILADHMFAGDSKLLSVGDLSGWRLNNATTTAAMFSNASSIQNLGNLDNWGLANDTTMNSMFMGMDSLTNLGDLSHWQTGKVTDMSNLFRYDGQLTSIGHLDNWDVSNVTTLQAMFDDAHSISDLGDLGHWNTSKVTNMGQLFREDWDDRISKMVPGGIGALKHVGDLSYWDTSKVTNMAGMFQGTQVSNIGDLSHWNVSSVGTGGSYTTGGYNGGFDYTFENTPDLTSIGDISNWDVHNVTQMFYMFAKSGIENINISGWQFNNHMADSDVGGVGTTAMFRDLVHPTKIIANNLVNVPHTFNASDFSGSQPLIVVSDSSTLQAMNSQSDGVGETGHPANTVHFVAQQSPSTQLGAEQLPFVFASQDALNQALNTTSSPYFQGTNLTNALGSNASLLNDASQSATFLDGRGYNDEFGQIAGNYSVNIQSAGKISYQDPDGHEISSTPLYGITGSPITITSTTINSGIPTGWIEVPGQTFPASVTPTSTDRTPTIIVKIQHGTTPVNPNNPVPSNGTTPTGQPINGAHQSDLNKTITRTINITNPDGRTSTTTQSVHLTRTATYDNVTGEVTYGNWTTGNWATFSNVPTIVGYTATQSSVPAQTVTSDTPNAVINITYIANAQHGKISYVDSQTGREIASTPLNGFTNAEVPVDVVIPAGWVEVPGQSIPRTVTATADTVPTVIVLIEHGSIHVTPKTPADQIPSGQVPGAQPGTNYPKLDNLVVKPTRTIIVTKPDGTTQTIRQTVEFNRDATIDTVTGAVSYGPWSRAADSATNWPAFTPQQITGYTISQDLVPEEAVTPTTADETVYISYRSNVAPDNHNNKGGHGNNVQPSQGYNTIPGSGAQSLINQGGNGIANVSANGSAQISSVQLTNNSRHLTNTQLPQTGNQTSLLISALGLGLLTEALAFAGLKKRRN